MATRSIRIGVNAQPGTPASRDESASDMKTDRGAEPATIFMAAYTNYRRDPRVRREAEALVGEGYRVVFLASRQPGEPKREAIDGVEVFKSHSLMNRRTSMASYLFNYAWFFLALMGHLIAHPLRYRLIHVSNMPDFLVFAAWLPRLLGTPVIHDVHDLMPELFQEKFRSGERHWIVGALKFQERWAGCFATAVLTVEERLKDILSRRGVPAGKIHVLMNLPDDRIFRPRSAPPTKTADGSFVLVYHGTLARRLGLDLAIEAVAKAKTEVPGIELRIIGAGEERAALLALRDAPWPRRGGHFQRRIRASAIRSRPDRRRRRWHRAIAHLQRYRHHAAHQAAGVRDDGNPVHHAEDRHHRTLLRSLHGAVLRGRERRLVGLSDRRAGAEPATARGTGERIVTPLRSGLQLEPAQVCVHRSGPTTDAIRGCALTQLP